MQKKTEVERRRALAIANACRTYLNLSGFLSEAENNKIHARIIRYRNRNNVRISGAQLSSVDFIYDDNAKED